MHRLLDVLSHGVGLLGRGDLLDQRMLGRQHHVGRAKQSIRPCRINSDHTLFRGSGEAVLKAFGEPVVGVQDACLTNYREIHLCPDALADPVALHDLDRLGPIDRVDVVEQPLGVRGDPQHPLLQGPAVDGVVAPLGFALVGDFLVGQHRPQLRAPVDGHLGLVRQAILVDQVVLLVGLHLGEFDDPDGSAGHRLDLVADGGGYEVAVSIHEILTGLQGVDKFADWPGRLRDRVEPGVVDLQENPLRPSVVVRVGGRHAARPVVAEPEHLDLPFDVRDVLLGGLSRVHAVLDGVLLRRQAERVVPHRVQHVESGHAAVAGDDVRGGVALGMPHVQPGPGRIGEHVQHVELPAVPEGVVTRVGLAERALVRPVRLPFGFDGFEVICGHGSLLARCCVSLSSADGATIGQAFCTKKPHVESSSAAGWVNFAGETRSPQRAADAGDSRHRNGLCAMNLIGYPLTNRRIIAPSCRAVKPKGSTAHQNARDLRNPGRR